MNFKKMILVDYLLNNILNGAGKVKHRLVFELNNQTYTGDFTPKNEHGFPIVYRYEPGWAFNEYHWAFKSEKRQELRSALFAHVFGSNSSGNQAFSEYINDLQHLVLYDVVNVVSELNEDDYFADDVEFPEVILNLKNMETNQTFDHYIVTGREFTPVSFIEVENE